MISYPYPLRYTLTQRPKHPLTYTFTDWHSNRVYLVPPEGAEPETVTSYSIAVELNLNPFLPLSYVTTVRRAGPTGPGSATPEDSFIGKFE